MKCLGYNKEDLKHFTKTELKDMINNGIIWENIINILNTS